METLPLTRKNPRLKIDKKKFLYPNEVEKILELSQPRQQYYINFLLNTGARINEARNVLKKDIDRERRTVTLWVTKRRAKLKESRPTPRTIAISSKFCKYILKNITLFKIPTTQAVDSGLKVLCKRAGVNNFKDVSSHNLRKTFGTWMLALGVDGFKLAQHLGHDPDTLIKSYASPDIFNTDDKDRMREILNDLPSRLREN